MLKFWCVPRIPGLVFAEIDALIVFCNRATLNKFHDGIVLSENACALFLILHKGNNGNIIFSIWKTIDAMKGGLNGKGPKKETDSSKKVGVRMTGEPG